LIASSILWNSLKIHVFKKTIFTVEAFLALWYLDLVNPVRRSAGC